MLESRGEIKAVKLVRVRILHDGNRIDRVEITGDFMLHPEEALEQLELSLVGLPSDADREEIQARLDGVVGETGAEVIGFSTAQLAGLIREVLG